MDSMLGFRRLSCPRCHYGKLRLCLHRPSPVWIRLGPIAEIVSEQVRTTVGLEIPRWVYLALLGTALLYAWGSLFYRLSKFWWVAEDYQYGWAAPVLMAFRFIGGARFYWRAAIWWSAGLTIVFTFAVLFDIGGLNFVRHFTFPVLFVLTAVPWPYRLEIPLTITFMKIASFISSELLNLFGAIVDAAWNNAESVLSRLIVRKSHQHDESDLVVEYSKAVDPEARNNVFFKFSYGDALDRIGGWRELYDLTVGGWGMEYYSRGNADCFRAALRTRAKQKLSYADPDDIEMAWRECLSANGNHDVARNYFQIAAAKSDLLPEEQALLRRAVDSAQ
jgi:Transmembrane exosortase (Exosortase_EpsH)